MPKVENFGGRIGPWSMFSKVRRWEQKIFFKFLLRCFSLSLLHSWFWYRIFGNKLKDKARYTGLLLVPAEAFFCSSGRKRAYYAVLAHFRLCSSNIDNLKKTPKTENLKFQKKKKIIKKKKKKKNKKKEKILKI